MLIFNYLPLIPPFLRPLYSPPVVCQPYFEAWLLARIFGDRPHLQTAVMMDTSLSGYLYTLFFCFRRQSSILFLYFYLSSCLIFIPFLVSYALSSFLPLLELAWSYFLFLFALLFLLGLLATCLSPFLVYQRPLLLHFYTSDSFLLPSSPPIYSLGLLSITAERLAASKTKISSSSFLFLRLLFKRAFYLFASRPHSPPQVFARHSSTARKVYIYLRTLTIYLQWHQERRNCSIFNTWHTSYPPLSLSILCFWIRSPSPIFVT